MSRLAIITFITPSGVDIDNGLPAAPVFPNQGLPGTPVDPGWGHHPPPLDPGYGHGRPVPIRPDNGLPVGPPGSIGTLPVYPWDPTLKPDTGFDEIDNALPPNGIRPGLKLVVKWLACQGLILVPDNELPDEGVDTPDQELPETAEPK